MVNKLSLDQFDLLQTLGLGSFGRVKYARHKAKNEYVAIKFMKKHEIMKTKQVDHINAEKDLMSQINFPFVVNMIGYGRDSRYIFIVMECIRAGELFGHLRRCVKFPNKTALFYASQIVLAFQHLHSKSIIHRDLKPENVLIDSDGFCKLTDFGFAKVVELGSRTYTLCGTPEYIAPEVLLNKGHGRPVDWWTFGILTFEMLVGQPPFCDDDPMGIYQRILAGKIVFPKLVEKDAKSLIKKLLVSDLSKRYGNLKNGSDDILAHRWFSGVNWLQLLLKNVEVPYKPDAEAVESLSAFEKIPESRDRSPLIPVGVDPFQEW